MFNSTMNLLERLFNGIELCVIAKIILDTQDIHEESWDGSIYTYDMMGATKRAVEKHCEHAKIKGPLIHFLSELNDTYWNEAQEWAKNITRQIEDPLGIDSKKFFEKLNNGDI